MGKEKNTYPSFLPQKNTMAVDIFVLAENAWVPVSCVWIHWRVLVPFLPQTFFRMTQALGEATHFVDVKLHMILCGKVWSMWCHIHVP